MTFKFKPTYNFQSAEFEMEIQNEEEFNYAMETYERTLLALKDIVDRNDITQKPQQSTFIKVEPKEPKEQLATDKQKETMIKLGIPYTSKTTKKEAWKALNEAVNNK